jgi:sporulation protein YlmC with PRC-barrel domain
MKIYNSNELIGKEVYDATGNAIGWVDKTWNSWNEDYPGYFFGIKMNDFARNTYFRGANKLFPVYNDYIRTVGNTVTLTKTMDDLCRYWNKTVPCGPTTCPVEELIEMTVYDKFHSRVGTFTTWVESNGQIHNFGVLLDPYICETWHLPYNTTFPVEPMHITTAKNTITLDQALAELKEYWQRTRKY